MTRPPIVSATEWQAARERLLVTEKAATRARDALAAQRRRLPMVCVEKDYVFEGPPGQGEPGRPLRRAPAADRLPLHVRALGRWLAGRGL
ncbi:MAG: DUF899 family protein [Pseudonocardiaceae bacterium]